MISRCYPSRMMPGPSPSPPYYLATDLDRTLFPNGAQTADDCMTELKEALIHHKVGVIYVTGRNQEQIREGMATYDPPPPEYAIAEVGTRIHRVRADGASFHDLESYTTHLKKVSPSWNRDLIEKHLLEDARLELQAPHNQNPFKISFNSQPEDLELLREDIPDRLNSCCSDFQVICSVDETTEQGLVDVLPAKANKLHALDFLRLELGLAKEQIIYSGDSGNDLEPLTSDFRSILVANATDAVRQAVRTRSRELGTGDSLFLAQADGQLNGCYYSGILQGLRHYGIIR
jgi:HAD superfamily hydrolase (TIGR01484 family)